MADVTAHLVTSYSSSPASVGRARDALASFAARVGGSAALAQTVRLAASEAMTNAVRHGYGDGDGRIDVVAEVCGEQLRIAIGDDGRGMRGDTGRSGLGLGLAVIAELCEHMTLEPRPSGGTELRMCFDLTADELVAPTAPSAGIAPAVPARAA